MANRFRRVPFPAKMDSFETKICRDQRLMALRKANHSAIVTDAVQDMRAGARAAAYAVNQKLFGEWQDQINIFPFRHALQPTRFLRRRDA